MTKPTDAAREAARGKSARWHNKTDRTLLRHVMNMMRHRCENKQNNSYHHYGGKGIRICDEWSDFEVFYQWALANGYRRGLEIDRRDGSKGYSPENCRWATRAQQNANRVVPVASSGFRGVYPRCSGRWQSCVSRMNKLVCLGTFDTKLQAALAYDDAAVQLHGEFAVLNFPERIRARLKAHTTTESPS